MSGERLPFGPGVIVLGGGAVLLGVVLLIGFLLPTDWEASAEASFAASPSAVFAYLDSPEGWRAWTPWPDSGVVREGPARGSGATLRWDDRELGSGVFRLLDVRPDSHVTYEVEVNEGAMRTAGTIAVEAEGSGSRVRWREQGNLGRNPLMGFWALFMSGAQSSELAKGLERLGSVAVGTPADSSSTGAR